MAFDLEETWEEYDAQSEGDIFVAFENRITKDIFRITVNKVPGDKNTVESVTSTLDKDDLKYVTYSLGDWAVVSCDRVGENFFMRVFFLIREQASILISYTSEIEEDLLKANLILQSFVKYTS